MQLEYLRATFRDRIDYTSMELELEVPLVIKRLSFQLLCSSKTQHQQRSLSRPTLPPELARTSNPGRSQHARQRRSADTTRRRGIYRLPRTRWVQDRVVTWHKATSFSLCAFQSFGDTLRPLLRTTYRHSNGTGTVFCDRSHHSTSPSLGYIGERQPSSPLFNRGDRCN